MSTKNSDVNIVQFKTKISIVFVKKGVYNIIKLVK